LFINLKVSLESHTDSSIEPQGAQQLSQLVSRGCQIKTSLSDNLPGAGVIGDITTAKERGGLIGIFGGSQFALYTYSALLIPQFG
jgi:hypothetical protein